jgi:hypothetical protein
MGRRSYERVRTGRLLHQRTQNAQLNNQETRGELMEEQETNTVDDLLAELTKSGDYLAD